MPKKPKTARTTFTLSTDGCASMSREELEVEKAKYERQIAAEFAIAISDRFKRPFEVQSDPLPEADERDAVLIDDQGVQQGIQLAELRDVDRQMRLARDVKPTGSGVDSPALVQRMLEIVQRKSQHYASSEKPDLWLVIHSTDYPTSLLMSMSRPARAWLASNPSPFSTIWVCHSTTQPDAGCIEQLWPPGAESDFVKAILNDPAPVEKVKQNLWRAEEIMSLGTIRRAKLQIRGSDGPPVP
jgi:hypothetical protein